MRKKLKALCSLHMLCATLFLFNLKAQTNNGFSIKGKVSDPNGGSLPYVNVFIEELDIGAVTNEKGRYQLEKIPSGQYTVRASLIGYKGRDRIVIVGDRGITGLDFILEEETQNLDEVVVKGKSEASRLRESAQAVTVVTTETVKLQAADMGDIMAKTEGVSVQRAGALGSNVRFSINGLADDQIRFFYDGIPLEFSPYAFGIANAPVNLIEQVEVYKGVVPIELGADALGGAINLVPQKIQNGLNGSASYQAGSFNTHRITGNISGANKDSGLFFSATGFYDYTDNNYKIDAAIANERGQLEQFEVERFHDGYRAAGADFVLGIRGKKWAKRLSVEGYYGDYDKDLQNSQFPGLIDQPSLGISNAVAGNPFGEVVFSTFSAGVNIDYALDFNSKWELGLKMGYNYNERESFDVGNNLYSWFGEVARVNQEAGEFGLEDNLITMSENVFARQQTTYSFNERHSIKLALSPTYTYRTADDLLVDGEFDPALDDNFLLNFVVGLEYTAEFAKGRLENIAFVKNYYQDIRSESVSPDVEGIQVLERNENNFGAGDAIRYNWSERFSTKLSYEYALRLPSQDEVFGDGQFILQNFELRPESSHNANLQWDYRSKSRAKMNWQLQGNLFLRQIDDLIRPFPVQNFELGNELFLQFQNVFSATSQGFELSGNISNILNGLTLSANTTYQDFRNTSKEGAFSIFEGDRIPNVPYFFVNGSADYRFENLFRSEDDFAVFYNLRYVNGFLIGFESVGLSQFKLGVPDQTVHSVGVTYNTKLQNVPTTLTVEVQNLSDAKVFDFFGVQRPGRAVFIKLTTQF